MFKLLVILLFLPAIAFGAVKTWDGGGANNNWTTAANWDSDIAPVSGDDLVFDGVVRTSPVNDFPNNTAFNSIKFNLNCGAFSITGNSIYLTGGAPAIITNHITLTVSISNNIVFTTSNPSITTTAGGTFNLSGTLSQDGLTLTVVGNGSSTINQIISGTGALTKSGTGTLILTANNTYTGVTTISAGTLQIGNSGTTGSIASASIVNNGILIYDRSDAFTVSTPISGTGSVNKNGAGTMTITNGNTYTGGFSISAGTISASAENNFGVPSGVKLIDFIGHGTLIVTSSFSTSKEITSVGASRSLTFDIPTGVTLTLNGNVRAYSGSGITSKNGAGKLVLAADNAQFDSDLYLNNGTAELSHLGCLGNVQNNDYLYAAASTTVIIKSNSSLPITACLQINGTGVNLIIDRATSGVGITHSFYKYVSNGAHTLNITAGANITSGTAGITIRYYSTLNGNSTIDLTDPGTPDILMTFTNDIIATNKNLILQGTGDFYVTDTIRTGSGTLTKNGNGILTLNGLSTFIGDKTLNAGTLRLKNSQALGTIAGTFIINGGIIDNTSGSALTLVNYPQTWGGDFTFTGTNDLNMGSGAITMNSDIIITVTNTSKNLTFGGNNNNGTRNLTKSGAGNIVFTNQSVTIKTLTISQGTLTSTSGLLNLAGNFTNSGTFLHNNGTISFNGGIAQTINGNSLNDFYNVTIANTSGNIASNSNINVKNTLILTSGKLSIQGFTLTMGTASSNGTISGGNSSSYIVAYDNSGTIGNVKHLINSAAGSSYYYPIGDATYFVPLTFTLSTASLSNAYLTIYTKTNKIDGLDPTVSNYIDRQWNVSESGFTSPIYTISYTYAETDIVGMEDFLVPIKKSGLTWYEPVGSVFLMATKQGTGSLNMISNLLTWSDLTSFSSFGGAAPAAVSLPINFLSFKGIKCEKGNKLIWETSSEHNNDFFTLEKTTDGELFEVVGIVNGAGNTNHLIEYSLMDLNVREVINYYRLIQTDFDGKTTKSDLISIDNSSKSENVFILNQFNILGQEVNENSKGLIFINYSNGEVMKVIQH